MRQALLGLAFRHFPVIKVAFTACAPPRCCHGASQTPVVFHLCVCRRTAQGQGSTDCWLWTLMQVCSSSGNQSVACTAACLVKLTAAVGYLSDMIINFDKHLRIKKRLPLKQLLQVHWLGFKPPR